MIRIVNERAKDCFGQVESADIANFTPPSKQKSILTGTPRSGIRSLLLVLEQKTAPPSSGRHQSRLQAYRHGGVPGVFANYSLDVLVLLSDFSYEVPSVIGTPIVTVPMG